MKNENLYCLFQSNFPENQNEVFLENDRVDVTFRELDVNSAKLVTVLRNCGVNKGDRVLVQVEKSPESILLYLACLRVGAIFIPLNTAYTGTEVDYFISNSEPSLIIFDGNKEIAKCDSLANGIVKEVLTLNANGTGTLIDRMNDVEAIFDVEFCETDDIAAMLYTSGTTGRSKGAMLTHGNLSSNAKVLHKYWEFVPGDVLLHVLPVFHAHGLFVALHCALLNRSRVLFHTGFNADAVVADLPRATVMMGVPTFYVRLLSHPEFSKELCRNIRLFVCGSAPLLGETFTKFKMQTGHKILERYGMTEALMITSNPYNGERLAETVGFSLPGISVRVVGKDGIELQPGEIGVLEIKGPNVFLGYWKMPEKTAEEFREDGYFITGDVACIDKEGRVAIVGREKDLVISGGYNVYPKEIESFIDEVPGVKESAVFGVPHADFGEGVTAVIVSKETDSLDIELVRSHLSGKLAKFKQPKEIFLVSDLPRNSMGKVQKNALRQKYADIYVRKNAR